MKKYPFVSKIATITGLALGAFALSALATGTWTAPSAAAPNGNVDAPINVGGGTAGNIYSQTKTGFLTLANFIFNPTLTPGSVTAGSVLTAKDTNGTVGWASINCSVGQALQGINTDGSPICALLSPGPVYIPTSADSYSITLNMKILSPFLGMTSAPTIYLSRTTYAFDAFQTCTLSANTSSKSCTFSSLPAGQYFLFAYPYAGDGFGTGHNFKCWSFTTCTSTGSSVYNLTNLSNNIVIEATFK